MRAVILRSGLPSDEDSNRRQRSATRSKPIKPKKLLSRYNPFIKAHRTDYLRGLQEELNQTCQLFLNKTPEPLQLSLIIRLNYLARILSIVADVRCLQYFTSSDRSRFPHSTTRYGSRMSL